MPSGSQPGERRGGRAPGTPKKRPRYFIDRLDDLDCDPLQALVEIACDPATDIALRARIWADLMLYLYPRRKSVVLCASDREHDPFVLPWADGA